MQAEPQNDDPGWTGLQADLRVAFVFLTRLPMRFDGEIGAGRLAAAAWAFPVVGLAVGVLAAIAYALADGIGLPAPVAALTAVAAAVWITGALHEDALADVADGFGGGRDKAAKLSIMRDSRLGSYGALALIFSVGLRVAALTALAASGAVAAALITAAVASRAVLPGLMRLLPAARADGMSRHAGQPTAAQMGWAIGIAVIAVLVVLGIDRGLPALVAAAAAAAIVGWLARRQIGGQTGDVLGSAQQAAEVAFLLALVSVPN